MRVVALGGCGDMGRYAVRTAAEYDFVDEIVVADIDGERAASFAEKAGPKATPARIDVADGEALAALLTGADALLNTVGPFYRFGVPILRAAIDAGCHYFDINDDWEPTLDMLAVDEDAQRAGITAVVGIGASPGVSNLLAAKAMSELDKVDDLITGWGLGGTGGGSDGGGEGETPGPSAALVHWLHQCSGQIRILRDGEFVDVAPIQEMTVDYPGVGTGTAWTVGHPEPLTLPHSRPELRNSCNVMAGPPWLIDVVRRLGAEIDAGRLTAEQAAAMMTGPAPEQPRSQSGSETASVRLPPLFALASGERSGRPVSVGATVLGMPRGGMGGSTGTPLAVALKLFAEGRISHRGVAAPEAAIDPDTFFDVLAPLCDPPLANGSKMVLITRSEQASARAT